MTLVNCRTTGNIGNVRTRLPLMSRKLILLLLLIAAGGLGCWAFFRGGIGSSAAPSPVARKPSPAGAPVAAVQPSAPPPVTTAPVTVATTGPAPAVPADSSGGDGASEFVAMRLDEGRIYVALRNDGIDFEKQTKPLTKLGTGPKFGPGPVFQADDDLLKNHHELFERVQVGEEWELDLSPASRVHAVVTAPVIVETGCFAGPGFVAQISTADQLSFAAAGGEYFLLHKPGKAFNAAVDPESKPIGELADWKATPEFAVALQKLLNERMRQELVKVHQENSGEYEREAAADPRAKPWSKIDDKLAH